MSSVDLDPNAHVLYLRICGIRRVIAKHKGYRNIVAKIIVDYLSHPETMPKSQGPIGMMIKSINDHGYVIGGDMIINKIREPRIDLLDMPWQHLKKVIFAINSRMRPVKINEDRTFHGHIPEIERKF